MRSQILSVAIAATAFLSTCRHVAAIKVDPTDASSVKAAAKEVTDATMTWYTGNETGQVPGLLGGPYYFWEGGAAMGVLIDYWYATGDDTYNEIVKQGLIFQASPTEDFMSANQTTDEGNDDQMFWGASAMTAAEYNFPDPPADKPQWLALAQGTWNSQQARWDAATCGGGLRWQIFIYDLGYTYKNSPANAGFINLSARLYAYTGNQTYADWAVKTWDWMESVGLISDHATGPGYNVYDGTYDTNNCSTVNFLQWTYSAGMLLNAAAVMWNKTGDALWEDRANGIWNTSSIFFNGQILWEQACERPGGECDQDELAFKGFFARFMAASTKWMPSLYDEFVPLFQASATAAAAQCTGTIAGLYGNACGFDWTSGTWDGTYGWGQQMDVIQILVANLIQNNRSPVSAKTGGTSKGDPSAGTSSSGSSDTGILTGTPATTASRAGAGILTAFVIVSWLGVIWWMYV